MLIDEGGGGGASVQWDSIGKSMDNLAKEAASGGFRISETGGKALLQAIRNLAEWVDGESFGLELLAQESKLGNSPVAQAMKPFLVDVAKGGQGFIPMLLKFRESLGKAEKAINDAMKNYKANEEAAAASLRAR